MNRETPLQNQIRLEAGGRPDTRLFRNVVGAADLPGGGKMPYGLHKGSSDLIGWRSVTITPQMVGRRVAVFVAIEVKVPGARTEPKRLAEQTNFILQIRAAGGLAGFAHNTDEAHTILDTL